MTTISITDYYTFSGTGIVGATPIGGSNGSTVSRAQNFSIRDVRECVGALSGEGETLDRGGGSQEGLFEVHDVVAMMWFRAC